MPTFPKPAFVDLLANYKVPTDSVHRCAVIDPTQSAVNTCAARMSEALVITNGLAIDRGAIAALGTGRGDGTRFLLGRYGYGTTANTGRLCPHGIGRGAQDLAAFLRAHWGDRNLGWAAQPGHDQAPANVQGKRGIVAFLKIPGFSGQGHIDLWNVDRCVGHGYWASQAIWFWSLE
jgi:hypothetical protein